MIHFFQTSEQSIFAVDAAQTLATEDINRLVWLFGDAEHLQADALTGEFVGPRREMITPWSTNAVEITQNMGIKGIKRIEEFSSMENGEWRMENFDPMLQRKYSGLNQDIFKIEKTPDPMLEIADIAAYNTQEGLALSAEEIEYLDSVSQKIGRKLTDSEVFGFSQVNSEHCRHKIFNGIYIIDGEEKELSLFKLIKKTSEVNPNKLVSAYKDNVAFNEGPEIEQFAPASADKPDFFETKKIKSVLSLKAETHNFPTTVEPFNGAATGTGGEIRDRLGGGKASLPIAGTAVYMTSYREAPPPPEGGLRDNTNIGINTTDCVIQSPPSGGGGAGWATANPIVYQQLKEYALTHRKNPTKAEELLWNFLSGKKLENYKFRRQHIIDDIIVDFVCLKEKLVVEVDGGYHNDPEIVEWDKLKEQRLKELGYRIIRFKNEEVERGIDKVLTQIQNVLENEEPTAIAKAPLRGVGGQRKWLYQTPEQILIKASNGASDFGNKFGQPLICGSVLTFEHEENGKQWGYDKVIMLAGGIGYGKMNDALKGTPEKGQKVVVMGGDNYRIGMGGGAVSSVETGKYSNAIELNAVQRANPEMQKRAANVIRALAESDRNPIVSIHDHGAGGHLNCLSELVEATGGRFDMTQLPIGDPTLSAKEIIGNESQERMGLLVDEKDIEHIRRIAERERAPMYVVGETTGDMRLTFEM